MFGVPGLGVSHTHLTDSMSTVSERTAFNSTVHVGGILKHD